MNRQLVWIVGAVVAMVAAAAAVVGIAADRDPFDMHNRFDPRGGVGMMGPGMATNEADYLREMVAHHKEAVAAAGELARSERSRMRAFGAAIMRTQAEQVGQMRTWLADWYPDDEADAVRYRPMMRDLSGLTGDRLDRRFLVDMVRHHMAAVMMSQHLLIRGTEHEPVAALARSIRDEQHVEIRQMRRWLDRWFDTQRLDGRHGHLDHGMTGGGPPVMHRWMRYR